MELFFGLAIVSFYVVVELEQLPAAGSRCPTPHFLLHNNENKAKVDNNPIALLNNCIYHEESSDGQQCRRKRGCR